MTNSLLQYDVESYNTLSQVYKIKSKAGQTYLEECVLVKNSSLMLCEEIGSEASCKKVIVSHVQL